MKANLTTKVAVLLSGGVDSSVSAFLLQQLGYEVVGLTSKMVDDENFNQVAKNAKNVADSLGIKHYVLDLSSHFKKNVIDYFENDYKNGKTPNPCIICNKTIKWGALFDYAINELKCDYVATGHYAKIENKNGVYSLKAASDNKKDQLYFLFELNQYQLSKTLFPLSGLTKSEVRKIATENNLPSKSAKESQDVCFIKKPYTTKKYLLEKFGKKIGNFVLKSENRILGQHEGCYLYTVGQRKGIGVSYEAPLYVLSIDSQNNIVYLGVKSELDECCVKLKNVVIQNSIYCEKEFEAFVKIRYNMNYAKGKVTLESNNEATVTFETIVNSVTNGQACVFYDLNDKSLIGGGWIVK